MPEPIHRKFLLSERRAWLPFACLVVILFVLYAILPSTGSEVFNSPDETASAMVARQIASHWRVSSPEPLAMLFPWLHPRSLVSAGEKLVPVGFLGWPFALGLLHKLFGDFILRWGGVFLLLSAVWPFFCLLRSRFGERAAWYGSLVAFTVPAMILYANRGLFSNGAVLALGLWTFWLLVQARERGLTVARAAVIGCMTGLTIAVRPVEMIWILPWWIYAGAVLRPKSKEWLAFAMGIILIFAPILLLANDAYGTPFAIGYRVHDNPPSITIPSIAVPKGEQGTARLWLPYGFHPKNILVNVEAFLVRLSWPWTLLVFIVSFVYIRSSRFPRSAKNHIPFLLSAWTIVSLLFIYGSGLYADHIGVGVVAIGNSFLRYLMPAALFCGWAFSYAWQTFATTVVRRRIFTFIAILLACFGVYRSVWADDEGVASVRRELVRYEQVRDAAAAWFSQSDTILSERSDKIFFPTFRAVSPLPTQDQVRALVYQQGMRVGFFGRPLSQREKDTWRKYGIDAQELGSFGRERLYRLAPLSP